MNKKIFIAMSLAFLYGCSSPSEKPAPAKSVHLTLHKLTPEEAQRCYKSSKVEPEYEAEFWRGMKALVALEVHNLSLDTLYVLVRDTMDMQIWCRRVIMYDAQFCVEGYSLPFRTGYDKLVFVEKGAKKRFVSYMTDLEPYCEVDYDFMAGTDFRKHTFIKTIFVRHTKNGTEMMDSTMFR